MGGQCAGRFIPFPDPVQVLHRQNSLNGRYKSRGNELRSLVRQMEGEDRVSSWARSAIEDGLFVRCWIWVGFIDWVTLRSWGYLVVGSGTRSQQDKHSLYQLGNAVIFRPCRVTFSRDKLQWPLSMELTRIVDWPRFSTPQTPQRRPP